jgi:hypothetical protein
MIWFALTVSVMTEDYAWMYNGCSRNGCYSDEWVVKTKDFVDHVLSLPFSAKLFRRT